jgi:hypothetical protein
MRSLGIEQLMWSVTFGDMWFKKKSMTGFACENCGYVFLMLTKAVGVNKQ